MKINVKVFPNSKNSSIEKLPEGSFKVHLKSPAKNNKANLELIKLLSGHFKSEVKIVKGKQISKKVIEVKNEN